MKRRFYVKADSFRDKHQAALERGRAKRDAAKSSNGIIDAIKNSDNPIETAFDKLVPPSGKADTVAGELVRAMMRILYRDYNDGDVFYNSYGVETCGDAVAYLCDQLPDVESKFGNIAGAELEDSAYTNAINEIADDVVDYIVSNPKLFSTANDTDFFDYDGKEFLEDMDWIPEYDCDISIPDSLAYHIDAGHISSSDVVWEVESWDWSYHCDNGEVSFDGDTLYFEHLDADTREEIEDGAYRWLEQWAEDLDEEYGSEDDEYDEDEE